MGRVLGWTVRIGVAVSALIGLSGAGLRVYPYLLRDLLIVRPDQVWCSDITYIRLKRGFAYREKIVR